jgi:hypothetical protein
MMIGRTRETMNVNQCLFSTSESKVLCTTTSGTSAGTVLGPTVLIAFIGVSPKRHPAGIVRTVVTAIAL